MRRSAWPATAPQRTARLIPAPSPTRDPAVNVPVQRRVADHPAAASVPLAGASKSALPARLRAGIEAQSGIGMGDVRVHRNSARPAVLGALAVAQGRDIHLGPGQDRHLPHEAWHIVQQRQGRVAATGQVGSTAINDDAALEAEADAMGNRALSGSVPPMAAPAPASSPAALSTPPPAQCLRARTHDDSLWDNPFLFRKETNWIALADRLEPEIRAVKDDVSDYSDGSTTDIQRLERVIARIEREFDTIVRDGNRLMDRIDGDRDEFLQSEDDLYGIYNRLRDLFADFQQDFLPSGGGFSASSRSTVIPNVKIARTKTAQNHPFFRDITIGKTNLNTYKVTKPKTAPQPGKIVLRSGSTYYDDDDYEEDDDKPGYDHPKLFNLPTGHTQKFTRFSPKKRDTTQDGAMGNVSARTYAWMSDTPGWNTQKWEWLHLRAASLGGATAPTNLVLGTRDANTHMMPFEANLAYLASGLSGSDRYAGITVNWNFSGQDPVWKYKVQKITIKWTVHLTDPKETHSGSATFYPLEAKAVLSRTETQFLESLLKEERESIYDSAYPEEEEEEDDDSGADDDTPVAPPPTKKFKKK